jgi:hypothetical protein
MARRLVHSWWRGDRIRVSPAAGLLLRLWPTCCLQINGQYVEVVDRAVQDGKPAVVYGCRTGNGTGSLIVERGSPTAEIAIEWREGGQIVRLLAADVEVYSKSGLLKWH